MDLLIIFNFTRLHWNHSIFLQYNKWCF